MCLQLPFKPVQRGRCTNVLSKSVPGCWSSIRESSFSEFSSKPRQTVVCSIVRSHPGSCCRCSDCAGKIGDVSRCRFDGGRLTMRWTRRRSRQRSGCALSGCWTAWNATTAGFSSRTPSDTSPHPRTDSATSRWKTSCPWMTSFLTTCSSTGCLPSDEFRRCSYRAFRFVT